MKILFIAPRYHTNLYYRIKALQDAGHELFLISLYQGKSECYDLLEPIVIGYSSLYLFFHRIISKFKKNYIKGFWELKLAIPNIRKLKQNIKEINPDWIILKDFQSLNELISLRCAKKFNKKVITFIQTNKDNIKGSKKLLRLYFKLLKYLNVKYFITPIEKTKKLLNGIGVKNISYTPFSYEIQNFNKNYFLNNIINIVSVGKFVQRKDQIVLLEAINLLKNKYKIKLTLVGEMVDLEYNNKIKEYINKNDLNNFIEMGYNRGYKEVLRLYKKNDLFVLPSYNEPAAISIVEAMANKLPVICSDDCGTSCYISEGKNGYIFQNKNSKDLAEKIELIIKDRNILVKMGERSFQLTKTFHSLEYFNKEFNEIINKIS